MSLLRCVDLRWQSVAKGHEQPICNGRAVSGLPPTATKLLRYGTGRFGPIPAPRTRSKNSLPLRRRTGVKLVTDLPIGA
jgi:hypothetical protein